MKAKCPYFGTCGGCSSQHIEYAAELDNKVKVISTRVRMSGIPFEGEIQVFSDTDYYYRNRMDFVFSNGRVGFRKKGSFDKVVDISECVISEPKINSLLEAVRNWFNNCGLSCFDHRKKKGVLRYCVIRVSSIDSSVCFVLNSDSPELGKAVDMINEINEEEIGVNNIVVARVDKNSDKSISEDYFVVKGNEFLAEELLGFRLKYHSQGFFQNNRAVAEKMVNYVKEKAFGDVLIDLYGGVGTFGVCLSEKFGEVFVVEDYAGSVSYAKENLKENNVKGEAFVCDAKSLGKLELSKKIEGTLCVVCDPPRSGMHPKAIVELVRLKPKQIFYVSCNPKQLSSDLRGFSSNYDIKSVAMFDMFPKTTHTETVVELVLKS